MKRISYIVIIALLLVILPVSTVTAQSATNTSWTSSITYYSPSSTAGELNINYYDGTTIYTAGPFPVSPHGAGSVNIGSTSVPDGFGGSAVLSANVPINATYVQFAKDSPTSYSRAFYTGFDESKAGSKFYLATVRANGISTTTFGVQNIESFEITATLDFFSVGATTPTFSVSVDIMPNATYISSVPDVSTYPGGSFDGSLVVTATKKGDVATPGKVVASAQETLDNGVSVYAFEGAKEGATEVYLPSAMCNRGGQTSYFAIQNTGDDTASVIVDYYNTSGVKVGSMPSTNIAKGAKLSTNPCNDSLLVGELGSAVVKSTNGKPLIAIGKVASDAGLITAFSGEIIGSTTVVAPYVRWAADQNTSWSAYLAIMNVGSTNAENIIANYYDASGTLRASHVLASALTPLAPFTKVNTNPSSAGALINNSFGYTVDGGANGGAVEIISDQPVVALVRLTTNPLTIPNISMLGEDYIGIAVMPIP
ncbi:MAG: hypothetical protein M9888_12835 [Chitinophagales bacterium]|nr:hypothetical protein [Chitinophagales bacterium]OJX45930.1 MAG: hypothetical protein BGO78_03315 [Chloroflexi bacterium 44-23]